MTAKLILVWKTQRQLTETIHLEKPYCDSYWFHSLLQFRNKKEKFWSQEERGCHAAGKISLPKLVFIHKKVILFSLLSRNLKYCCSHKNRNCLLCLQYTDVCMHAHTCTHICLCLSACDNFILSNIHVTSTQTILTHILNTFWTGSTNDII